MYDEFTEVSLVKNFSNLTPLFPCRKVKKGGDMLMYIFKIPFGVCCLVAASRLHDTITAFGATFSYKST